jgi:hypothetical protein
MFIRRGSAILRNAAGEGEAGGNGPKTLTEEDVGRIVNAAVTSQLKRALPTAISEAIGAINFGEQIEGAVKKLIPQPPADNGDGKGGKGQPTSDIESKLQKQLETIATELENEKKARQAAEQAREEAETQRKRDAALSAFRSGVAPKVKPELQDVFVEHFGSRRLKIDKDGNPLLTVRRAPYKGAPEEDADLPLGEALPLFLASKDVQPFLPAPGGQQGGDGRGNQRRAVPRVPGSDASDSDKADAALATLADLGIDPSALL